MELPVAFIDMAFKSCLKVLIFLITYMMQVGIDYCCRAPERINMTMSKYILLVRLANKRTCWLIRPARFWAAASKGLMTYAFTQGNFIISPWVIGTEKNVI